jgi:hypothetical protein
MKKKRPHLHTTFLKYLLEKQNEIQELPEEETNIPDNKLSDEFDKIINGDEVQDEVQDDDENIDDLIEEYRLLEKLYKSKTYGNIYNKRK